MLTTLSITNYAIIAELKLDFSDSLNIITGETGAGKSIMLGALSLITGKRADTKVLYDGEKKCIVEGIFDQIPKSVNQHLEKEGFDVSSELILRREINPKGKSRAFINDSPCNLSFLEGVAHQMLDLNRQFELLDIQSADFQLDMIDHLAGIEKQVLKYRSNYQDYRKKCTDLDTLKNSEGEAVKEYDFIKFQLNELQAVGLMSGEQKQLEQDLAVLDKAGELIELAAASKFQLDESETSMLSSLRELKNKWQSLSNINDAYTGISDLFLQSETMIEEIVGQISDSMDQINTDPGRKTEIESRLDILYALMQKHRVQTSEDLIEVESALSEKVSGFDSRESTILELEKEISELRKTLTSKAKEISTKRKKVFPKLEKKINGTLNELAMNAAHIKIVNEPSTEVTINGIDRIDILFSANKGSTLSPIKKVASGGELSRLMLAMKTTVADTMNLPTMIFDEIDTGVSGEVAHRMGQLMHDLGEKHQVIVITHSPQVAAKADKHFHIFKEESKKRTITRMKVLDKESRITEIAKMLSGATPTKSALSNAKELISVH